MSDHTILVIQVIRPFFFSSSVCSCPLFLISSACVRSLPFLFFIMPIFPWNVPLVSPVSLKRSLVFHSSVFLCFFAKLFLPHYSGILHSNGCIFLFLLCLLLFFSQLFVKPPQTTILPSCISFYLGWFWSSPPIQYYEPLSIVLQALCLPNRIPWIYLSLPLYNCKRFELGHTWMV